MTGMMPCLHPQCALSAHTQIDEFLTSGTISVLEDAGGFQKASEMGEGGAKPSGDQAMALKFL